MTLKLKKWHTENGITALYAACVCGQCNSAADKPIYAIMPPDAVRLLEEGFEMRFNRKTVRITIFETNMDFPRHYPEMKPKSEWAAGGIISPPAVGILEFAARPVQPSNARELELNNTLSELYREMKNLEEMIDEMAEKSRKAKMKKRPSFWQWVKNLFK